MPSRIHLWFLFSFLKVTPAVILVPCQDIQEFAGKSCKNLLAITFRRDFQCANTALNMPSKSFFTWAQLWVVRWAGFKQNKCLPVLFKDQFCEQVLNVYTAVVWASWETLPCPSHTVGAQEKQERESACEGWLDPYVLTALGRKQSIAGQQIQIQSEKRKLKPPLFTHY